MKKALDILAWIVYYTLSIRQRTEYDMGAAHGCKVKIISEQPDLFGTTVHCHKYPNQPNTREYLNFKEFMEMRKKLRKRHEAKV